ncbi:MAG TPA: DUF3108 domain-containing protein [Woeseiaceae bacterium]|nr:DUF3108 domain-containing protein [Woeseiaceae bacterium]
MQYFTNNKRLALYSLVLLLAASHASWAATDGYTLQPYEAEYKVKVSILSGKMTTKLAATDEGYVATHRLDPQGLAKIIANGYVEETADFSISDGAVVSHHYLSINTLTNDTPRAELSFDQETHSITGVVDGVTVNEVADSEVHDRISIQYELMLDLIKGGSTKSYVLFDDDKYKTIEISNIGKKVIRVPAGEFTAIGIQHKTKGSSKVTTLWCVPELDFLPAIIEQHKDKKRKMRAELIQYTPKN